MVEIIRAPITSDRGARVVPAGSRVRGAGVRSGDAAGGSRSADEQSTAGADDAAPAPSPSEELLGRRTAELAKALERAAAAEKRAAALERDVETRHAEAKRQGFEQGRQEGATAAKREADARAAAEVSGLRTLVSGARAELSARLDEIAQDSAVEIAFSAVTRVLGDALADRAAVAAIVREVARDVDARCRIFVHVSPRDYELLKDSPGAGADPAREAAWELTADERVELGGCIVASDRGELDGRLETQLRRLKEILLDVRNDGAEGGEPC
jgi:flagellar biosynthesis/type III secretory pathway protein FliH